MTFSSHSAWIRLGLLSTAASLFASSASAQQAPAPAAPTPPPSSPNGGAPAEPSSGNAIIITGTSVARSQLNTPMQATRIDAARLELLNTSSPADILTTIPMLKAEGGGGEVASNIFVAGLPSGGQYQFTPYEFNGIPVIGSIGLNSSAPDVYYRPDLGVERLEFVHGGVSNLFGGGSVGGLINFIDKTGGPETHGDIRLETGELGLARGDFALSGAVNANAGRVLRSVRLLSLRQWAAEIRHAEPRISGSRQHQEGVERRPLHPLRAVYRRSSAILRRLSSYRRHPQAAARQQRRHDLHHDDGCAGGYRLQYARRRISHQSGRRRLQPRWAGRVSSSRTNLATDGA